jgi:hypothetical protein
MSMGKELPRSLLRSRYFQALFAVSIHSLTTEKRRVGLELLATWCPED